jgi:hypothetical protein
MILFGLNCVARIEADHGRNWRSFILQIQQITLAIDDLPNLRDWHVNAGAAVASMSLIACGIVSGYSPQFSMVSKRNPVPSMHRSCGDALPARDLCRLRWNIAASIT